MYEGYSYYVPAKSRQKFLGKKKKVSESPPPPLISFFWDLGDFIGWQRTALAFLTPNPHPMLAALEKCSVLLLNTNWWKQISIFARPNKDECDDSDLMDIIQGLHLKKNFPPLCIKSVITQSIHI